MTEEGREWTNGLCGCFSDCKLCIISYIVPCYTAGKNAEAMGESCGYYGFCSLIPIANCICGGDIREKIREKNGIRGTSGGDIMMHAFCHFCALVQEAQEIKATTAVSPGGAEAMDRY